MGCSTSIFGLFFFWCFTSGLCMTYRVYILTGLSQVSSARVEIRLVGDGGRTSAHMHSIRTSSKNKLAINDQAVGKLTAVELYLHSDFSMYIKKIIVIGGGIYSFVYYGDLKPKTWSTIQFKCPHGFEKGSRGTCVDIDECQKSPCKGPLVQCHNTVGSYLCVCPRGYRVRYGERCEDINECMITPYLCDQKCDNTPGSYRCYCRSGYKFVEGKCFDINECEQGSSRCDLSTTTCSNSIGGYSCDCKPGHTQKNHYTCQKTKCSPLSGFTTVVVSPPRCSSGDNYYGDVCSFSCKNGFQLKDPKINSMKCSASGGWEGTQPKCKPVQCPPLSSIANGEVYPSKCTTTGDVYQERCNYVCNQNYHREGSSFRVCQANKTWSGSEPTCKKIIRKPTISCPPYIRVDLAPGQNTSDVSSKWKDPTYTGDTVTLTVDPPFANAKYRYPAGQTKVTWTATNSAGSASCKIYINVDDKEAPKVTYCPKSFIGVLTNSSSAKVTWKEPTFTDNVGVTRVTSSRKSGDVFKIGSYNVYYYAYDKVGNSARCKIIVIVKLKTCVLPPVGPFNGSKTCNTFGGVKYCTAMCPAGKQLFRAEPHKTWTCINGAWTPTTKIPDCVAATEVSNGTACHGSQVRMSINNVKKTIFYCVDCPTGTYSANGKCIKCPVGQYQDEQGRTTCKPCSKGLSSNIGATEAKECRPVCPAGQYSPDNGLNPGCQWCPKGAYQDQPKSTHCKKCPNGTSTFSIGSVKHSDCGVKPTITSLTAKPSTINEKQDTTISCYVSGIPIPSTNIVFKKNIPAAFLGKMKLAYILDSTGKKIGIKLVITGATYENTGQYECTAQNFFAKVTKETTLTVNKVIGGQG